MGARIRIVVADDHEAFRESLVHLLSLDQEIEVVGEAADGKQALDRVFDLRPDVAILDLKMPGATGTQATRRIKEEAPQVKVIVLSVFSQIHHIRECLEAGADRYLTKGISREELLAAVKAVAAQQTKTVSNGRPRAAAGIFGSSE
ncbi:MAG: response regulator [Thermoleophilia bacterium]